MALLPTWQELAIIQEIQMEIENLKQPPLNTTLMGVLRGVLDYYHIQVSTPMAYGGSGHALLINIHELLCPSGPYCWNREPFLRLTKNLGIEMIDHGFFSSENSQEDRRRVEAVLVEHLVEGTPCSLLNMENQLILGYDDTGFITTQPWGPHHDVTPKHLAFGSWEEFGDEVHVNFFTFGKLEPANERKTLLDSLEYAVDLFRNPTAHTSEPYGVGPRAYANWMAAVRKGEGSSHGNWWNATVWAECRTMASEYFGEIAEKYPSVAAQANELASAHGALSDGLRRASDKEMDSEVKIELLEGLGAEEQQCISEVEQLAAVLLTGSNVDP